MADIHLLNNPEELVQAAGDYFIAAAASALEERQKFTCALSGGNTPLPLFRLLASSDKANKLDWRKISFFWGDERPVPPQHPDSNFGHANQLLLEPRKVPATNIHRIQGELDPPTAAALYQQEIQGYFQGKNPCFDLIFLGLGSDGHTASLFPGTRVVLQPNAYQWVAANQVPQLDTWRITLTSRAINAARLILFLVSGASKAKALEAVLEGPYQPDLYPAQLVQPDSGKLVWLIDQEAGKNLSSKLK
jgi:6-phosphogluconolactonase